MTKIVITTNSRGQCVVRIMGWGGSIHDEAAFASTNDALEWAAHFIRLLEPSP